MPPKMVVFHNTRAVFRKLEGQAAARSRSLTGVTQKSTEHLGRMTRLWIKTTFVLLALLLYVLKWMSKMTLTSIIANAHALMNR